MQEVFLNFRTWKLKIMDGKLNAENRQRLVCVFFLRSYQNCLSPQNLAKMLPNLPKACTVSVITLSSLLKIFSKIRTEKKNFTNGQVANDSYLLEMLFNGPVLSSYRQWSFQRGN